MKVRLDWLKDPLLHLAVIAAGIAGLAVWHDAVFRYDVDPINYAKVAYLTTPHASPLPVNPIEYSARP